MPQSFRVTDTQISDHHITCPLTVDPADGRTISVFARVVARRGGEELPYLVFLQGGPGNEGPALFPDWMPTALERYRVVLVDQRGTGKSTPVATPGTASTGGNDAADNGASETLTPTVANLKELRADGIVRDCEALREHLGVKTWNVLGQSFGGFTLLHYLTAHPEAIDVAFFTGGLAPVNHAPEEIYATTYRELRDKSLAYYRRFPQHRAAAERLVGLTTDGRIVLPSGEVLSASRARSLGHLLGSNDGWLTLFHLLDQDPLSRAFAYDVAAALPFNGRNPLYYVLHESSMASGASTRWAAERALPEDFASDPTLLTGEHVFSQWLDTVPELRPWGSVAEDLAQVSWPNLYDIDALKESGARGAAAVYARDAYVPLGFSLETAGYLPGVKTWVTSEYEHNGLRGSGGRVLRRLFELADDSRVR